MKTIKNQIKEIKFKRSQEFERMAFFIFNLRIKNSKSKLEIWVKSGKISILIAVKFPNKNFIFCWNRIFTNEFVDKDFEKKCKNYFKYQMKKRLKVYSNLLKKK